MTEPDPTACPRSSSPNLRLVAAPKPHMGIGQALRRSFGTGLTTSEEWSQLLARLR